MLSIIETELIQLQLAILTSSMMNGNPVRVFHTGGSVVGVCNRIEREDGSGRCYNVTINEYTVFVRLNTTHVMPI